MTTETVNQQPEVLSDVTFHLAAQNGDDPYRRVAGIVTAENAWRDGYIDPDSPLEQLKVALPGPLSERMIAFARRHIGPDASDQDTRFYCHSFAEAVGLTAVESTVPEAEGVNYGGYAQAASIYENGSRIVPDELGVGEHGVVGDPDENKPATRGAIEHSMVGIGEGRAIQVEGPNAGQYGGHLYLGRPADYVAWLDARNTRTGAATANPGLYVHRDPQPATQSRFAGRFGTAVRDRARLRRKPPQPTEVVPPVDPWL